MKELFVSVATEEEQYQAPGFVVLHLPHTMIARWTSEMEQHGFVGMPPVVVVGCRVNVSRPHTVNPAHAHETWYPFCLPVKGVLSNAEKDMVEGLDSKQLWRSIYKSAHKAELAVTKEERKAVNDGAASMGFNPLSEVKTGKKVKASLNFRYVLLNVQVGVLV